MSRTYRSASAPWANAFRHPVRGVTSTQPPPDVGTVLRGQPSGYGHLGKAQTPSESPSEPPTTLSPSTLDKFSSAAGYLTSVARREGVGKRWRDIEKRLPRWVGTPASNTVGALLRVSVVFAGLCKVTIGWSPESVPTLSLGRSFPPGFEAAGTYAVGAFGLAASSAGINATSYAGGWWANWLVGTTSTAALGYSLARSSDPEDVAEVYRRAAAKARELGGVGLRDADKAAAYLDKLRRMGTSEDRSLSDVLREGGQQLFDTTGEFFKAGDSGGEDRKVDWVKVGIVGGIAVIALAALAPYARLATELADKVPDAD